MLYPVRHRRFRQRKVRARVIDFFVAHLAIYFQHAVVVFEHVAGDGAREGILHVGVYVHLHHSVFERLVNLAEGRPRAAVKHKIKARSLTVSLNDSILAFFQDARLQLYMSGFIDAVERQGFNRRLSSIRFHYHPVTLLCPENPLKRKATHAHTKTTVQEKVYGCHKKFVANLEGKKRSITAFF